MSFKNTRDRVHEFIQAMVEGELDAALMRPAIRDQ